MRLNPVLILFGPTRVAFAEGTPIGPLLDRVLSDRIRDHVGSQFVGGGEVYLIPEVKEKDIGLLPAPHRRNVGGG